LFSGTEENHRIAFESSPAFPSLPVMKQRKHTGKEPHDSRRGGVEYEAATGMNNAGPLSVAVGVTPDATRKPSGEAPRARAGSRSIDDYVRGILDGDRVMLGRTITLVESRKQQDTTVALEVLWRILPHTGRSLRVGITGVPGVGKSTFIEALGQHVISLGHRLAVLAIDPSSQRSSGSIMGDKTRMESLARHPDAFIRPSPSAGSLGGVAHKTREAMLLCEAAGFDIVFVETVGVGQSETLVHSMVDVFLLLLLPNAGDQLQGIKRGIMELADAVIIHKADGENLNAALRAKTEFEGALHLLSYPYKDWLPPVLSCSSLSGDGIDGIWDAVTRYHHTMLENGELQAKRRQQSAAWMHDAIRQGLHDAFHQHPSVKERMKEYERMVLDGELPALAAAHALLGLYTHGSETHQRDTIKE
jgi:LAO/AO transport system kinase